LKAWGGDQTILKKDRGRSRRSKLDPEECVAPTRVKGMGVGGNGGLIEGNSRASGGEADLGFSISACDRERRNNGTAGKKLHVGEEAGLYSRTPWQVPTVDQKKKTDNRASSDYGGPPVNAETNVRKKKTKGRWGAEAPQKGNPPKRRQKKNGGGGKIVRPET